MLPEEYPSNNSRQQSFSTNIDTTSDANIDDHKNIDALNNLRDQFSDFLQQNGETVLATLEQQNASQTQVTLYNLFSELAALKTEVKRESKQVKDAVGQFSGLLDTLTKNNQQLSIELERQKQQDEKTGFAYRLPLLENVLDLSDSLQHTLENAEKHKPSWWERRSKRAQFFRQDMIKGLEITQRRINKMLQQHNVNAINCIGKKLDPHTMKAVKLVKSKKHENGIVLAEIRKGYIRHGEVIRLAEAVVNKI